MQRNGGARALATNVQGTK